MPRSRSRSPAYSKRRRDDRTARYDPKDSRDRHDDRDYRDRRDDRRDDRRHRDEHYDRRDRERDRRSPRRREDVRERDRGYGRDRERSPPRGVRSDRGDRGRDDRRDRRSRSRDAGLLRRNRERRETPRRGEEKDHARESTPVASEQDKKKQRLENLKAWKQKKAEEEKVKGVMSPLDKMASTNAEQQKAPNDNTATSASISTAPRPKADQFSSVAPSKPPGSALPTNRPVSTFGFGAAKKANETGSVKRVFGDEESSKRKLERLPSPIEGEADTDGVVQDVDEDTEMQDATEEEAAAAARAAAEKRAEAQASQINADAMDQDDEKERQPSPPAEAHEDIDPLDAFMNDMSSKVQHVPTINGHADKKEELFDENELDLTANENDPEDILALAQKMKRKKELPSVQHDKVEYEPFRVSFYVEPKELAKMSEQETDELRLLLDGIKVRGQEVPKPVQKWSQCGLPSQTLQVIQDLGYDRPTSIQAQALPAIMSGRNVIGVAKTGSGKTIAFLLPMFRHIKDQRTLGSQEGPISVIMTPTRELAVQIYRECKPFLKALNLRAVCAYGGSAIRDQIADLKRGAEIIVCTPGRMIDLLAANSGRVTNLKRVTYVVLDEADRMFDMGFEPQVMKIIGNVRPDRQTVLFSATFPRQMEALARKILVRPVEIVVGARSTVAPEITQIVEVRTDETKFHRLLELLGELYDKDDDARTLIFVDRQESADGLMNDLMRKGYPCMAIHGGKDQIDRDSTISDFKNGVFPVLVATSVAARGLDVKQLKLVINYDCPNHMEDYVHRVGRTGRAGNTGTAVTFISPEQDRYAVDIARALRLSKQSVPDDVQKLADTFQEKVKAGKEKASGSGFGGKGLDRLDEERDRARKRERKQYGEEGAEEAPVEEKEVEEKVDVRKAGTPAASGPVANGPNLDDKIVVHKRGDGPSGDPLARVMEAAANIGGRLSKTGQLRNTIPIDNKGPDAGAYHATLEINDFPQKARWAVTNRTNIAKVLEQTGTSITTKGSYYPPGKAPEVGADPKLYILVEGDTELVVTNAMRELKRLLAEGTTAAMDSESRAPASGRYNVLA